MAQLHDIVGHKSALAALMKLKGPRSSGLTLTLSDTPQDFAAELYDALYRSENTPDQPMLMMVPQGEGWQAINDRLVRSAGFKLPLWSPHWLAVREAAYFSATWQRPISKQ